MHIQKSECDGFTADDGFTASMVDYPTLVDNNIVNNENNFANIEEHLAVVNLGVDIENNAELSVPDSRVVNNESNIKLSAPDTSEVGENNVDPEADCVTTSCLSRKVGAIIITIVFIIIMFNTCLLLMWLNFSLSNICSEFSCL